ncbi:MAG: shikimate dehydrogenase [Chloroflexi bacterium]|nr:shikimate dehydrogenase [Chloroflexota bacterium]
MTQYLGIIGYPLGHSISPVFQQAALDHHGLDICYQAWETPPEELPAAVDALRQPDRLGMNVTVPHKEAVLPYLDRTDDAATAIRAVNTVVKEDGRLVGYNTDCSGFLRALREDAGVKPEGLKVLVLGAGGAARAVLYGLVANKAGFVGVASRNGKRVRIMVESMMGVAKEYDARITMGEWRREGMAAILPWYDLVVNTTPMGMLHGEAEHQSPLDGVAIPSKLFVYDLVYNPTETPLLRQAREAGCRTLGGLPMLVYQGAAAFQLWTEREAPVDVMFAAARNALRE